MEFWVDMGVSALLRVLKNRRDYIKFQDALAKLFVKMQEVFNFDSEMNEALKRQQEKRR